MKADLNTILRDIKAAARIGHTESVWTALDNLQGFPQIAGNHQLDGAFLKRVIIPVGQALAHPLLNPNVLRPLISHENTGIRAVAGAALAERYLKGLPGTRLKDLQQMAKDLRQEVREAILLACAQPSTPAPEKQAEIFQTWLSHSSPQLQGLALQLLSSLPESLILEQLPRLEGYDLPQKPEVRQALAEAVTKLGQGENGLQVLAILSVWAENPERYYWVITRSLSRSWAARFPEETLAILTHLAAVEGGRKKILGTLKALQRHGANEAVQAALEAWRLSDNPRLRAAAQKADKKRK